MSEHIDLIERTLSDLDTPLQMKLPLLYQVQVTRRV